MTRKYKKKYPHQMFQERLEHEGGSDKLRDFKSELSNALGTHESGNWSVVFWPLAREWGYKGAEEERFLYEERLSESKGPTLADNHDHGGFESSLSELPLMCEDPSVEWDWVSTHPAMTRLDRESDKTRTVLVSGEDITSRCCPSQKAARMLQHWSNRPKEFFNKLIDRDKHVSRVAVDTGSVSSASTRSCDRTVHTKRLLSEVLGSYNTGSVDEPIPEDPVELDVL